MTRLDRFPETRTDPSDAPAPARIATPDGAGRPGGGPSAPPAVQIRLTQVWKKYHVTTRHTPRLGSWALSKLLERLRRSPFWALRGVSLDVKPGEIIGVLGRNGSGKSTLLKLISGITPPTRGTVEVHGRVASLLELGVGFHPELTGMENIFYHAALQGMPREQVMDRLGTIIEFSGLQDYLYEPVKHYSSGMYARLGCSVALHIDANVALIDEALAVGDSEFRAKTFRRLRELIDRGVTVLLVTHEIAAAAELCPRLLWIEAGKVAADGPAKEVRRLYEFDQSRRRLVPGHLLRSGFESISGVGHSSADGVEVAQAEDTLRERREAALAEARARGAVRARAAAAEADRIQVAAAPLPTLASLEIELQWPRNEDETPAPASATWHSTGWLRSDRPGAPDSRAEAPSSAPLAASALAPPARADVVIGSSLVLNAHGRFLAPADLVALRVLVWREDGTLLADHLSPGKRIDAGEEGHWRLRWSPLIWLQGSLYITASVVDLREPDRSRSGTPVTVPLRVTAPEMPGEDMPYLLPCVWQS